MAEKLVIPATAFVPKPHFETQPGQDVVREIKEFIKKTGAPHLWHGHTHSRPPKGSYVEYIGEYDLPEKYQKDPLLWAPCPCCLSEYPKYCRHGKIAWFPEEKVVRNMGGDCFKSLNASGHYEAIIRFRALQQKQRDISYLLDNLALIPAALTAIEHATPITLAIDQVRVTLIDRLDKLLGVRMWDHIRDGKLKVRQDRREVYRAADQTEQFRIVSEFVDYGPIAGHIMIQPTSKSLSPQLKVAWDKLQAIRPPLDLKRHLEVMNEQERKKTARALGYYLSKVNDLIKEASEARRFLMPETLATLSAWSRHPGCPIQMYISMESRGLHIGQTVNQYQRLIIPSDFFRVFPAIPRIAETEAAE